MEIHAGSIPAKVVGGDFYDAICLDGRVDGRPDRLGLMLGDVSGKSIPASLLMVASREIVWAAAKGGAAPDQVFRDSNERIYSIKRRMFVALGYYILDPESFELHYSIAGMPTPMLSRVGEREVRSIDTNDHRIPLGSLREVPYDSKKLQMQPGDLVFLYSDGFTETMDAGGEPFGEERLADLVARHRDEPLEAIGAALVSEVRRFASGADPYDDMTFLLLRISPDAKPSASAAVWS